MTNGQMTNGSRPQLEWVKAQSLSKQHPCFASPVIAAPLLPLPCRSAPLLGTIPLGPQAPEYTKVAPSFADSLTSKGNKATPWPTRPPVSPHPTTSPCSAHPCPAYPHLSLPIPPPIPCWVQSAPVPSPQLERLLGHDWGTPGNFPRFLLDNMLYRTSRWLRNLGKGGVALGQG